MGLLGGDTPRDTAIAWGFVVVQFALIVAIVLLPAGEAWPLPRWLELVGRAMELAGVVLLVAALVSLNTSLTALPTPTPHSTLKTGGLYRVVRHPIYSALVLLAAGATVVARSWWVLAATVALAAWFSAKARWEERHLRARYPDYEAYAARVPRFVPGWPAR